MRISWDPPFLAPRPSLYGHYDPAFSHAFYDGTWMEGVGREGMLRHIRCSVAHLKANTRYGKDGVLYAANTDEDTERVQALVSGCERIDIKSGHDIHAEHPDTFVSAYKRRLEG